MSKGMQCVANSPKDPVNKNEGWVIDRPGQAKESFGGGTQVSDIR